MMIRRNRGFKLGRKLIRVFKWVARRRRSSYKYHKLEGQGQTKPKNRALAKIYKWGRSIRYGFFSGNRAYIRVGQDPVSGSKKSVQVPKGYLSVYVGDGEDETIKRVLVPILFLNHPLFGKLLKEAEDVYGFDYPGRIMIPCPISEFENVRTKIAAGEKCRPWIQNHSCVSRIKCL